MKVGNHMEPGLEEAQCQYPQASESEPGEPGTTWGFSLEEAARDRMACLCDLFEAADSRGMPGPQARFRSPGVN